jgi:hypothetical protein
LALRAPFCNQAIAAIHAYALLSGGAGGDGEG